MSTVAEFRASDFLVAGAEQHELEPVRSFEHNPPFYGLIRDMSALAGHIAIQSGVYEYERFAALHSPLHVHDFSPDAMGELVFSDPYSFAPTEVFAATPFVLYQNAHTYGEDSANRVWGERIGEDNTANPSSYTLPFSASESLVHVDEVHLYTIEQGAPGEDRTLRIYARYELPNPSLLNSIKLPDGDYEFASNLGFLYIMRSLGLRGREKQGELTIWEIRTEGELRLVSQSKDLPIARFRHGEPRIHLGRQTVYIRDTGDSFGAFDVTDPAQPLNMGAFKACLANAFESSAKIQYCVDGNTNELLIIDILDPSSPKTIASMPIPLEAFDHLDRSGFAREIIVDRDSLYLVGDGLVVIDISAIRYPEIVQVIPGPAFAKHSTGWKFNSIAPIEDRIYAAMYDYDGSWNLGLAVLEWDTGRDLD